MTETYSFFITCPLFMESLLADELKPLGAQSIKQTQGGIYVKGDLNFAYHACLWSRLANRVLLILVEKTIEELNDLYNLTQLIDWSEHFNVDETFYIHFYGENSLIRNTMFGAQKVKDAIVDQFRNKTGKRPTIVQEYPTITLHVYLSKSSEVTISLDLSGTSLHQRGYRLSQGTAPLKENLAAALLIRSNWPELAKQQSPLIDPLCGSGTLLIEALLMAADIAPGLNRNYYGFLGWKQHQPENWKPIYQNAIQRKEQGLTQPLPPLLGYDADPKIIEKAKNNLKLAHYDAFINLYVCELAHWHKPNHLTKEGLIITNPPYGERLADQNTLLYLYQHLAERSKLEFCGWQMGLLTGNLDLAKSMKLWPHKKYKFFNGALACEFYLYQLRQSTPAFIDNKEHDSTLSLSSLSSGEQMLVNRLQKNKKKLTAWIRRENISCYRIYDADIPEYAAAIDCYQDYVHIQEYAAPLTIDEGKAQKRLNEIINAVSYAFNIDISKIIVKQRKKQKGSQQYQKLATKGISYQISEYECKFLVNLTDYLDTGLFLDHRPVRRLLSCWVKGKNFLNLFCYTATASVCAAQAGANYTTSVDLSPTYVTWARQNLALNGFGSSHHQVIEFDCFTWLKQNKYLYDVIFLDPPTFSNSKRTKTVIDIQADHEQLINLAMLALKRTGLMIFSINYRKFKLDPRVIITYQCENITDKTFDPDFSRDKKLHQCWLIRHK